MLEINEDYINDVIANTPVAIDPSQNNAPLFPNKDIFDIILEGANSLQTDIEAIAQLRKVMGLS